VKKDIAKHINIRIPAMIDLFHIFDLDVIIIAFALLRASFAFSHVAGPEVRWKKRRRPFR
jgi:hypothetical protein